MLSAKENSFLWTVLEMFENVNMNVERLVFGIALHYAFGRWFSL